MILQIRKFGISIFPLYMVLSLNIEVDLSHKVPSPTCPLIAPITYTSQLPDRATFFGTFRPRLALVLERAVEKVSTWPYRGTCNCGNSCAKWLCVRPAYP